MRKILTFLPALLFSLLSLLQAKAQVLNGDIVLDSQADVDAFNYTEVNGKITVSGNNITNLNGLSELTKCTELSISINPNLTNIIGLANLQEVVHTLRIRNNFTLTSLAGLSSLVTVGAFIEISSNSSLVDLDGLFNLEDVGSNFGNMTISNNNVLADVDGLSKLTRVPGLIIENNASLVDIDGLSNLESIGFTGIVIENNDALTNIDGLHKVPGMSGELKIIGNSSLTNINGLSNLTHLNNIDGRNDLEIKDNPSLANIDGLSKLTVVREGNLVIHNNDAITNIDALSNLVLVGIVLNITDNLLLENVDGLSSLEAVNGLVIGRNNALTNLDGLAALKLVIANVSIELNPALTDFCGLSNLFENGEIGGSVTIKNNGANTLSITPPPDIILNNDPGLCSKDISAVAPYVATVEGCLNPSPPSRSDYPPGNIFQVGTTNIIWSAYDGAGNTATAVQKVIITDNEVPAITQFPQDVAVQCAADVPAANIGSVTATDNCPNVVVTYVGDVITNQTCANRFTLTRTYKATDGSGNTTTRSQIITVNDNTPPQITGLSASKQILAPPNHKMQDITLEYEVSDNCNSSPTYSISISSNEPLNGTGDGDTDTDWEIMDDHHIRLRAERAATGTGRIYTITITASDGCNSSVTATTEVRVTHNITAPNSGKAFVVGSSVNFSGEFWDKPGNKHTAKWLIDGSTTAKASVTEPSGNKNGKVTGSYKFNSPGVYKLRMNTTDQNGVMTYANTNGDVDAIVVIYDPNGGNTYGGGYFNSPAGALTADPSATGKASYGFAMNYFKNSTYPKGETQFEFKVGDFEFNALNFDYLVISNSMAQFKGTGKIMGGQSGIGFTMTVVDGQLDGTGIDKIRMKIYNKNNGFIIYDNQPGSSDASLPTQAVGANSVIVISGNNASLTSANTSQKGDMEVSITDAPSQFDIVSFPNPSTSYFNLNVKSNNTERITMQVVDMYGRVIEVRNITTGSTVRFGDRYNAGTYFVRIMQGKVHNEIKLIKLFD
ncbi:MAG TPA: T9SS type A sorting domain-containing protein [Chitinophagaceae bacterium]